MDFLHQECEELEKGQSRTWMLLLYPDNEIHKAVLNDGLPESGYDYIGICHDKDEGIKPHHHVVVICDPRTKTQISNRLSLDERWIRKPKRQKQAIRYLLHLDNPDKFQYSKEELYGTWLDKADKMLVKDPEQNEAEQVDAIISFLNSYPYQVTYAQVIIKANQMGCYSALRRMGNLACKLIDEHNKFYVGIQPM